jgi:hypothetical protein
MKITPSSLSLPRCLSLFAVFVFTAVLARAATLTVTVSSADSAHYFQRARVELSPGGREAFTDAFGVAEFLDVAPGDYTARITYVGFPDATATVRVTSAPRTSICPSSSGPTAP